VVRCCLAVTAGVIVVVLLAGCGSSATTPSASSPDTSPSTRPTASVLTESGLTVVGGDGDLGDADYGDVKSAAFTVRNDTPTSLTLYAADKSCECAGVEIQPSRVGPGQTATVSIRWEPKLSQYHTDYIRLRTTIQAMESPRLSLPLEARGRIKPTLLLNLPKGFLDFGKLLLADVRSGRKELAVEVFTQKPEKKDFRLEVKSLSPGLIVGMPEPLTADRLLAHQAVAGYRFVVRPTEALPAGAFRETVRLTSDLYPGRDLDLTVEGILEHGLVSLSRDRIDLPARIPLDRGYICPPLEVELRGESGRSLKVARVEPPFLVASVEPVPGRENVWRLQVRIPAGEQELRKTLSAEQLSEYISYGFNSGAIVLESDHPRVPVIRIPVSPGQFQR